MQQDPKEAFIAEKMERMKKENQRRMERYAEVEADRQNADHFSSQTIMNQTGYLSEQPRHSNTSRPRRSNQSHGGARKPTVQRLPLSDGPPPDPTFNFLSDPARCEENRSETINYGRDNRQNDKFRNFDGQRGNRGDFRGSRGRGSYYSHGHDSAHNTWSDHPQQYSGNFRSRGTRSRGRPDYEHHGNRSNYERRNDNWRQERSQYDDERIRRSQTQDGKWKREWDADKMYHANQTHRGRQGQGSHRNSEMNYSYERAINSEIETATPSGDRVVSKEDSSDNLLISISNQAAGGRGPRRGYQDRRFRGNNRMFDESQKFDRRFDSSRGNRPRSRRPRGNYRGNNERTFRNPVHNTETSGQWSQAECIGNDQDWNHSIQSNNSEEDWDKVKITNNSGSNVENWDKGKALNTDMSNEEDWDKANASQLDESNSSKTEEHSETNTYDSKDDEWEDVTTSGNDSGELSINSSSNKEFSHKDSEMSSDCIQLDASNEIVDNTDVPENVTKNESPIEENVPKSTNVNSNNLNVEPPSSEEGSDKVTKEPISSGEDCTSSEVEASSAGGENNSTKEMGSQETQEARSDLESPISNLPEKASPVEQNCDEKSPGTVDEILTTPSISQSDASGTAEASNVDSKGVPHDVTTS